jgi:F-type H+-transporting ATPase subunit b
MDMADSTHAETPAHGVATMEHPAPGAGDHAAPNPVQVSGSMMGLTWLTFGLLALVLYKVAWKPILTALDKREHEIRTALDEARLTREEYARIEEKRRQLIDEADAKAKEIVTGARQAAVEASAVIETKAREEAQILLANAQRELKAAHEKALADLRRESADLAIGLSRKIIGESLDEKKSRDLVDRLIKTV